MLLRPLPARGPPPASVCVGDFRPRVRTEVLCCHGCWFLAPLVDLSPGLPSVSVRARFAFSRSSLRVVFVLTTVFFEVLMWLSWQCLHSASVWQGFLCPFLVCGSGMHQAWLVTWPPLVLSWPWLDRFPCFSARRVLSPHDRRGHPDCGFARLCILMHPDVAIQIGAH